MGLKKESEKALHMDKKDISLEKEKTILDKSDLEVISQNKKSNRTSNNVNNILEKEKTPSDKVDISTINNDSEKTSNPVTDNIRDNLKKGVNNYKNELEKNDDGVKFTGQTIEKTYNASKKVKEIQKNKKLKKAEHEAFERATEKLKDSDSNINIEKKASKLNKKSNAPNNKLSKKSDIEKEKIKKFNKGDSFTDKIKRQPQNLVKKGTASYSRNLSANDDGVKVGTEGTKNTFKLSKASYKAIKNVRDKRKNKNNSKLEEKSTKLQKEGKLKKSSATQTDLKKDNKSLLRKRRIKRNVQKNQGKKTVGVATKGVKNSVKQTAKSIKVVFQNIVQKAVSGKALAFLGAISIKILPVLLVLGAFLALFLMIGGLGTGTEEERQQNVNIGGVQNLSPAVEQWRDLVTEVAEEKGMEDYINLILAIIQVESGGDKYKDIMQSSESAGYPRNYFQDERQSVEQGITHLKNSINLLKGYNSELANDIKAISQTYNFGLGFARYLGANNPSGYDIDIAEQYSRDVVAVSLGNTTGETYSYVNEVSKKAGKTYLYRNGGNFLYGEMVAQYIGSGTVVEGEFQKVIDEMEKYLGDPYVWGGKNPQEGFDCSGFTTWGLKVIGIDLPSYAAAQYDLTVPIDESEARPGDLVFFKGTYGGPNHVSHVGFYIDENTMFDSNGSGIGYTKFTEGYWKQHYAGIRRIK